MPYTYSGNPGLLFYKLYFKQNIINNSKIEFHNIKSSNEFLLNYQIPNNIIQNVFFECQHNFELETIYPGLLIGSGYIHDLGEDEAFKVGFFFDYTTGLPVIPGSSVKGILRSVFPGEKKIEKKDGEIVETSKNRQEKAEYIKEKLENLKITIDKEEKELLDFICELEYEIFEGAEEINVKENGKIEIKKERPIYKRDLFYDAFIAKANSKGEIFGDDTIALHKDELKNPIPLSFLKILPEVKFQFNFDLKDSKIIKELTAEKKKDLFREILLDFGAGAKTNVGYGQFVKVRKQLPNINISGKLSDLLNANSTFECKLINIIEDYYYFEFKDYPNNIIKKKKESSLKKLIKKGITELKIDDLVMIKVNQDYDSLENLNFQVVDLIP